MARPQPKVILADTDVGGDTLEVIAALEPFVICYAGKPVALRRWVHDVGFRMLYPRTSFSGPGHADNLAEKLNQRFQTDKFSAKKLKV